MTRLPTIYTARSDVDTAHLGRVEEWYAGRHAPDLIRAGFYTAQVYYSDIGAPRICNLYEIPGPELFLTPAYRDVAAKDTDGPAVIALLTSRSNTIYEQLLTAGDATVDAPALSTCRFELPVAEDDALIEWYHAEEFPRLRRQPGFRGGRLCRRGPPHPTAASRDPRWFAINEWDAVGSAMVDGTPRDAAARHQARFPALASFAYNVGHRTFRLTRSAS
jgi:hypothetical protein